MIRPVGDIFQDGKVTLKVVECGSCKGCYYNYPQHCNIEISGYCGNREDSVIFKRINPETSINSQEGQILNYLESGKSITQLEALNMFDCMRLSARVYRLKNRGHNIKTLMVSENGKHFAKYYL